MPPIPMDDRDLNDIFERITAEQRHRTSFRQQWLANPLATVAMADTLGRRHAMAPWLPADALVIATFGGADDEMFGALAEAGGFETAANGGKITRAQQVQQAMEFLMAGGLKEEMGLDLPGPLPRIQIETESGLWRYVKGATRGATGVMQSGYEAVQSAAASRVRGIGELGGALLAGDPAAALGAAGAAFGYQAFMPSTWQSTTAGQAVSQLVDEGRVDVGEGFFVGPQSQVGQAQAQRAREVRGTVDGHAWTVGRAVASTVFEPGSQPYNYLSGAVDLAGALGLDPAN